MVNLIKSIVNSFEWLVETVTTLFEFVSDFIANLFTFFQYLTLSVAGATNLVLTLPPWLQAFGTICITVSVIYMIVGRKAGGKKGD